MAPNEEIIAHKQGWTLTLSAEQRDTVVACLRHDATVQIEGGEGSTATVKAYVEGINAMLAQLDADPVRLWTFGG